MRSSFRVSFMRKTFSACRAQTAAAARNAMPRRWPLPLARVPTMGPQIRPQPSGVSRPLCASANSSASPSSVRPLRFEASKEDPRERLHLHMSESDAIAHVVPE